MASEYRLLLNRAHLLWLRKAWTRCHCAVSSIRTGVEQHFICSGSHRCFTAPLSLVRSTEWFSYCYFLSKNVQENDSYPVQVTFWHRPVFLLYRRLHSPDDGCRGFLVSPSNTKTDRECKYSKKEWVVGPTWLKESSFIQTRLIKSMHDWRAIRAIIRLVWQLVWGWIQDACRYQEVG